MPKRTDLHRILIIGSGPIVIGQACEFDYSGTQACKALRAEGYEVILVNSNPATIMTDPEFADRTYIEPLTWEVVERIIAKERPDALLPTVGGQTGLNLAVTLAEKGVLERYGVRLIGASLEAIRIAEDRELFKSAMTDIGLPTPRSAIATTLEEALRVMEEVGLPAIIRPSFTLGGTGGGIARTPEEFRDAVLWGLSQSPAHQVLIEESVLGWKEYELEVMRDARDNFVVVCSIENFDPMGVHTGDSITVAPAQTLTDKEYQQMRDWARRIICRVGVETGGSNIQFAVNPQNGEMVVIEMNPRVSRSSALASKATGFPIAKIAAKLAAGYTLDEIPNDITRETMASFEPTIDYVVVKIPRWAFEKFPGVDDTLGTQMKSVGEAMAIGRTFKEALQKGLRSLESGLIGLVADERRICPERLHQRLTTPNPDRVLYIYYALQTGMSVEEIATLTSIDPWFIHQIAEIVEMERSLRASSLDQISAEQLWEAKRMGFSDAQMARFWGVSERQVRQRRLALGIRPVYKRVDTCGAEFEAYTPYLYSTYETECEADPADRPKVIILGSGPNRIGQGIEFDYCCCHAAFALREMGMEAVMVNCNPETVSTDYDTSDRLYFEPLTLEDVLNIVDTEQQRGHLLGVIVQFGGQTPLKLTLPLHRAGVRILGTPPDSIDLAEDRERFSRLLKELEIPQPEHGTALTVKEARLVAACIGYPVLVRPSYVLGGRAMAIVYDQATLERCVAEAIAIDPNSPVLIDRFLEDAFEMDVDCIADGERAVIGAIMEQIELAGVHSGDSACVIPTYMVAPEHLQTIREYTYRLAEALQVRGLMNVQMAMKDGVVYVLEVNPRASRTIPYVSKATGVPLARLATQVIMGKRLVDLGFTEEPTPRGYFVKEVVLPFVKFREVDALLSPEMKSTGEVMGMADDFGIAFAKAQMAAGNQLPVEGTAFLSVNDNDKANLVPIAQGLAEMGFRLMATGGTAAYLRRHGLNVEVVNKVYEGHPHAVDYIEQGLIDLVINTPLGRGAYADESAIRKAAVACGVAYTTTLSAASAAVQAIRSLRQRSVEVRSLQEWYHTGQGLLTGLTHLPQGSGSSLRSAGC